jgi:hypothetical protein
VKHSPLYLASLGKALFMVVAEWGGASHVRAEAACVCAQEG